MPHDDGRLAEKAEAKILDAELFPTFGQRVPLERLHEVVGEQTDLEERGIGQEIAAWQLVEPETVLELTDGFLGRAPVVVMVQNLFGSPGLVEVGDDGPELDDIFEQLQLARQSLRHHQSKSRQAIRVVAATARNVDRLGQQELIFSSEDQPPSLLRNRLDSLSHGRVEVRSDRKTHRVAMAVVDEVQAIARAV